MKTARQRIEEMIQRRPDLLKANTHHQLHFCGIYTVNADSKYHQKEQIRGPLVNVKGQERNLASSFNFSHYMTSPLHSRLHQSTRNHGQGRHKVGSGEPLRHSAWIPTSRYPSTRTRVSDLRLGLLLWGTCHMQIVELTQVYAIT